MDTRKKRLLLIDDHHLVRLALRALLNRLPEVEAIDEAGSLAEGVALAGAGAYALVLLDLELPDSRGLQTLSGFLAHCPGVPLALISGDATPGTISAAMLGDIRGYICKTQAPEVIQAAVGLILAGGRFVPDALLPSLAPVEGDEIDPRLEGVSRSLSPAPHLTPRQRAVLELIVQGRTNKEISLMLGLSLGTVKNYVSAIFGRLNLPSRTRTINHVMALRALHGAQAPADSADGSQETPPR